MTCKEAMANSAPNRMTIVRTFLELRFPAFILDHLPNDRFLFSSKFWRPTSGITRLFFESGPDARAHFNERFQRAQRQEGPKGGLFNTAPDHLRSPTFDRSSTTDDRVVPTNHRQSSRGPNNFLSLSAGALTFKELVS